MWEGSRLPADKMDTQELPSGELIAGIFIRKMFELGWSNNNRQPGKLQNFCYLLEFSFKLLKHSFQAQ